MAKFFSLTDLGLQASSSQLLQNWLTQMQTTYPGYNPSASSLEYVQAVIFASLAADLATLCSNGGTELFRTYGTTLVGLPYQQGVAAQAVITVTAQTAPGTIATTSSALSTGGPIVAIPVVALPYNITAGTVTLTDPTLAHTQSWTTSGANPGDTQISVSSQTPNFAYPAGSTFSSGTATQAYLLDILSQFTLDSLGFQTLNSYLISAGTVQNVTVTAVQPGIIFNGAGSNGNVQSVQQLPWVSTTSPISVFVAAAGGQDPEDNQHYLDRLTTTLQLQAPRPITAGDFATMALNFTPYPGTDQQEVGRATAVDGYSPTNGLFNNTRTVTVAATDANGFALNSDTLYGYPGGSSSGIITSVPTANSGWGIAGWLQSLREINFVVNVISPTYSAIFVTVTVKAASGWDSTSVQQNVQTALLQYLSPSSWGLPPSSRIGWQNTTTIVPSTLNAVIQSAPGVLNVVTGTLKFGLSGSPSNTIDLALPGPVALPTSSASTIPLGAITVQ